MPLVSNVGCVEKFHNSSVKFRERIPGQALRGSTHYRHQLHRVRCRLVRSVNHVRAALHDPRHEQHPTSHFVSTKAAVTGTARDATTTHSIRLQLDNPENCGRLPHILHFARHPIEHQNGVHLFEGRTRISSASLDALERRSCIPSRRVASNQAAGRDRNGALKACKTVEIYALAVGDEALDGLDGVVYLNRSGGVKVLARDSMRRDTSRGERFDRILGFGLEAHDGGYPQLDKERNIDTSKGRTDYERVVDRVEVEHDYSGHVLSSSTGSIEGPSTTGVTPIPRLPLCGKRMSRRLTVVVPSPFVSTSTTR
jgi:hypothetical protein